MAINLNGFPYDSQIIGYGVDGLPEYDRASNSEEFASLLHSFWRDGVFGESALTVLAGSGMTVTVGTGSVLIQGRVARVTSAKTLTFDTADSQPRFDRVVARSDLSNSVRDIVLDVVKGMPASSPVAPALTRNQTKWELCLATVRIPANISVIRQSNITDTRLDSELCGLVAATMTDVDTTMFYEQIQSDLKGFREVEQNQFLDWFDSIRDVLDENAAGNLYNKIENLTAADVGAVSSVNGVTPDENGNVNVFQPVNLFDNSNFQIAQAGYNELHGTERYAADRWPSSNASVEVTSGGIKLTGSTTSGFVYQRVRGLLGKKLTFAVKFHNATKGRIGVFSANLGVEYATSGYPNEDGLILLTLTATEDTLAFLIYPVFDNQTIGSATIDPPVLYEGTYTAETLPPYVPKWDSVELAECKRYYRQSWVGNAMTSAGAVSFLRSFAETGIRFGFGWGEPMRGVPTVTIYGWATGAPIASNIVDVDSSQNIPISGAAYISNVGFALLYDYTKLTAGKEYIFHYSASCDI